MSDSKSNANGRPRGGGLVRKLLLFGTLAILCVGLAYEYRVSRPSVDLAYDKITDRVQQVNATQTETLTRSDIHSLVGSLPSRKFTDENGDLVEVFSWRRGVPFLSNDLYTVYKEQDGEPLFHRHSKYGFESATEVSIHDSAEPHVVVHPPSATSDDSAEPVE